MFLFIFKSFSDCLDICLELFRMLVLNFFGNKATFSEQFRDFFATFVNYAQTLKLVNSIVVNLFSLFTITRNGCLRF